MSEGLCRRSASYCLFYLVLALVAGLAHAAPRASVPREPVLLVTAPERQVVIQKSSLSAVVVEGFSRNEIRKFLMLASGPESTNLRSQVGSAFLGEIGDDRLRLKNSPLASPLNFDERARNYRKMSGALWKCVRYRVADSSIRGLKYPPRQPGCTVQRVDTNTALASGGLCFFGIDFESSFTVAYEMNPDCAKIDFLVQNGIVPQDFFSFSGYYIAGDATGTSLDLTPLESARIHFVVEPSDKTLPLSTDFGRAEPRWPSQVGFDAHLGNLRLFVNGENEASVESPLLVSNRCPPSSRGGSSASRCDFSGAVGALMQLYSLPASGAPVALDFWYAGGVAPASWEGMLPAQRKFSYPFFEVGKRYRILADLSYTDTYYRLFRDSFRQLLINLSDFNESLRSAGLGTLPALMPLSPIEDDTVSLPTLPPIPGLAEGGFVSIWEPLEALRRMIKLEDWPPYYQGFCRGESCASILDGKARIVLSVDFTVLELARNQVARLGNFVVRRESSILPSYEKAVSALPDVEYVPDP